MLATKNAAYHPVIGLMPSPLKEVPEELGWYREEWATPYMAAIARVVFRRKPAVTLKPQLGPERIIERVGGYVPLPLAGYAPDVTLTPQPVGEKIPLNLLPMPGQGTWRETTCKNCGSTLRSYNNPSLGPNYNIPAKCPVCGTDLGVESVRGEVQILKEAVQDKITALGTKPEFGEWFKEKRGLVIVVVSIVALVLLLFFFKKRRA